MEFFTCSLLGGAWTGYYTFLTWVSVVMAAVGRRRKCGRWPQAAERRGGRLSAVAALYPPFPLAVARGLGPLPALVSGRRGPPPSAFHFVAAPSGRPPRESGIFSYSR